MYDGISIADYSDERVVTCLNSEVVNSLGNLLSRCTAPAINPQQVVPHWDQELFHQRASQEDLDMMQHLRELPGVWNWANAQWEFTISSLLCINSLHAVAQLWHLVRQILVNIGWSNGLLPDGTKPLPQPMLTIYRNKANKLRRKLPPCNPLICWRVECVSMGVSCYSEVLLGGVYCIWQPLYGLFEASMSSPIKFWYQVNYWSPNFD